MKLILYRDPYSEAFLFVVGHIDTESGFVYRDAYSEGIGAGNCIGHVCGGYVFSDPYSESVYYKVGHYRDDGRIYAWGHVDNHFFSPEAAAAFMLLLPR